MTHHDDFGNLWGSWGNVNNHYLYTGQEYDADIQGAELYNLRARYYDPKVGRFTSEDPKIQTGLYEICFSCNGCRHLAKLNPVTNLASTPQNLNCYPYAVNNPLRYVDHSGRQQGECCYDVVVDWNKFWQCIKESYWSTEISAITSAIISCVSCFMGYEPGCYICFLSLGANAIIVANCLDQAISLEPAPGPCPPSPARVPVIPRAY